VQSQRWRHRHLGTADDDDDDDKSVATRSEQHGVVIPFPHSNSAKRRPLQRGQFSAKSGI